MAEADRLFGSVKADEMVKALDELPIWTKGEVIRRHGEWIGKEGRRRVLVLLEGCIVDVGGYLEDHVSLFEKKHRIGLAIDGNSLGETHYYYRIVSPLSLRPIQAPIQAPNPKLNPIHHQPPHLQ